MAPRNALSSALAHFLSTFKDLSVAGLVPQKEVSSEDVGRFRDILKSDLFVNYTSAQSTLDDPDVPTRRALPRFCRRPKAYMIATTNC
jgi:hypothetical protein